MENKNTSAHSASQNNKGIQYTDIAVIGAGPVGLALTAWLLRDSPWQITLIDARLNTGFASSPSPHIATTPPHTPHPLYNRVDKIVATPPFVKEHLVRSQRMLALAAGSRMLLEDCEAWPENSTPISTIHVSQRHHFGRTLIRHSDYEIPALGYVVAYDDLLHSLSRIVHHYEQKQTDRLRFLSGSQVEHIETAETTDEKYPLTLTVQGLHASTVRAKLLIHAEGELFHQLLDNADVKHAAKNQFRDYEQTALLGTVSCNAARSHWAWERFTDEGPLALLPIKHTQAAHTNIFSLVWVGSPENCAHRMNLNDSDFLDELNRAFGQRMGKFESISGRHTHALHLRTAPIVTHQHRVAIGNAAQTLHPVAGQGFNLGLRDAYLLAQALQTNLSKTALEHYTSVRHQDRNRVIQLTDFLPRVFCTPSSTLKHMLGLGLFALDLIPIARHALAQQMMFGVRTPVKNT